MIHDVNNYVCLVQGGGAGGAGDDGEGVWWVETCFTVISTFLLGHPVHPVHPGLVQLDLEQGVSLSINHSGTVISIVGNKTWNLL